jgi:hypothetical protein
MVGPVDYVQGFGWREDVVESGGCGVIVRSSDDAERGAGVRYARTLTPMPSLRGSEAMV